MLENLSTALKFLNSKVKLVGIGNRSIFEGNITLILGLLWTIILRFQVQEIEIAGVSGKKGLIMYVFPIIKKKENSLEQHTHTQNTQVGQEEHQASQPRSQHQEPSFLLEGRIGLLYVLVLVLQHLQNTHLLTHTNTTQVH